MAYPVSIEEPRASAVLSPMNMKRIVVVLADISGYTRFIHHHRTSVLHAEQIITDLLDSVVGRAEFPLKLNKLEGDAALLYSEVGEDEVDGVNDVARQIVAMMSAFDQKHRELTERSTGGCVCSACRGIGRLRLKVFAHVCDAVVKTFRGFEELAGEGLIAIHRLMKNDLPQDEYVLLTAEFSRHLRFDPYPVRQPSVQCDPDLGPIECVVFLPTARSVAAGAAPRLSRWRGIVEAMRLFVMGGVHRLKVDGRAFRHLPPPPAREQRARDGRALERPDDS